jgi:hypothetical protein
MNTEQMISPAIFIQHFDDLAAMYGFKKYNPKITANVKGLKRAINWLKEVPSLSIAEFIEVQIRAVDPKNVPYITFSALFKNKQVCLHRCGLDAVMASTAYNDYLVYFDVVMSRHEKAVNKHIPGPWYSCRDDILLDPNRKYPKWFIIMEITDTDKLPEDMLKAFIRIVLKETKESPALKKLLKEKYERNSENTKYHDRLGKWL